MKSKKKVFRNMKEIQREFFPNDVGKVCPYCQHDIIPNDETEEAIRQARERIAMTVCESVKKAFEELGI